MSSLILRGCVLQVGMATGPVFDASYRLLSGECSVALWNRPGTSVNVLRRHASCGTPMAMLAWIALPMVYGSWLGFT